MLRPGRVTLVDDSGPIQRLQISEGSLQSYGGDRLIDQVPKVGHFGLISVPPIKSEILLIALAGDRTQTMAIGSNHQPSRPKNFQPGDAGIHDVRSQMITLTAAGVTIDAAGLQVTVRKASKVRCECDVETTGDVISRVDGTPVSLNALHDAYNAHAHPGVQSGGSSTGTTDHTA